MRKTTWLYQIDGKPILTPDADVQMSFADLDSGESGRDEAGFMHRVILRRMVGSWQFCYATLSQEEYSYMLSILPNGGSFTFTYPDPSNPANSKNTTAYLSQYGISWRSAQSGLYHNLKFNIIEC